MPKKELKQQNDIANINNMIEFSSIDQKYIVELDKDPRYTLEIDPTGQYKMTDTQKEFIKNYIEFRNVPLAAKLTQISDEDAKMYYRAFGTKKEIERINMALYQRRFARKMFSVEEIGAYLSSQLTDEYVPMADRLSSKDKLTVARMILDIHKMKAEALNQPEVIDAIDVENQLKDLSVESIQQLIETSNSPEAVRNKMDDKEQIIDALNDKKIKENNVGFSAEEVALMKSLPIEDLLKLLETANGKDTDGKRNQK